jgi:hypothetical protein
MLQCSFIDSKRYVYQALLEELEELQVPFPFVSRPAYLTLCTIKSLVFTAASNRKSVEDGKSIVDFNIVLQEYKVNYFTKLGVKVAWVAWATATLPDPATATKMHTTPPESIQQSAIVSSEYMQANGIDDIDIVSIGEPDWNDLEIEAANILNKRFDLIPISSQDIFPQTFKLQYPNSPTHYQDFNNITELPDDYDNYTTLYSYPEYIQTQNAQYIFQLVPKQSKNNIYLTVILSDVFGNALFGRKVVPNVLYNIGPFEMMFNEINIDVGSVNGSSNLTSIIGGVRLKQ